MQTTTQSAQAFVSYPQMVTNLFKTLDTDAATLHHATTGMSGETAELLECFRTFRAVPLHSLAHRDLDAFYKELGDWRFYTQAVWNIYGWEMDSFVLPMPGSSGSVNIALENMIIHSGAILDVSKKDWVTGKEVDARVLLEQMEGALAGYNDVLFYLGVTDEYICELNREKLAKRHPAGVYTDAAQIARADKADEFQPGKFNGNDPTTVVN